MFIIHLKNINMNFPTLTPYQSRKTGSKSAFPPWGKRERG